MHATISKWGNSLALRLPRNLAEEVHLSEGASVDLVVEDGALKITPSRKKFKLSDLLADEPRVPEADWGKLKGDEAW